MARDENGSVKMPGWIFKTLLGWALIVGHGGIVGYVADHYDLKEARTDISRMYDEGTKALKDHLVQEARSDAKFEGVQEKIVEISVGQKEMRAEMQQMMLMQRDLLNAVERRSPTQ